MGDFNIDLIEISEPCSDNFINTLGSFFYQPQLIRVNSWLCANKLSLNIEKSSFVMFHPPQGKLLSNIELILNEKQLRQDQYIQYLGVLIDSNLSWKLNPRFLVL